MWKIVLNSAYYLIIVPFLWQLVIIFLSVFSFLYQPPFISPLSCLFSSPLSASISSFLILHTLLYCIKLTLDCCTLLSPVTLRSLGQQTTQGPFWPALSVSFHVHVSHLLILISYDLQKTKYRCYSFIPRTSLIPTKKRSLDTWIRLM